MLCNKGYFQQLKDKLKDYDLSEVSEISGVPYATMYAWLNRKTQNSLQFCNFVAVAEAIGFDVKITLTRSIL